MWELLVKVSAPIAGNVYREPAEALGSVHVDVDAALVRGVRDPAHRKVNAGDIRDVGDRNHLRVRTQGLDKGSGEIVRSRRRLRNRHPLDREAVAGRADIPRERCSSDGSDPRG